MDTLENALKALIKSLQKLLADTKNKKTMLNQTENSIKVHQTAVSLLGQDASPRDLAPDRVSCAETVNAIFKKALGQEVGGALSTYLMYEALKVSTRFAKVDSPLPGDIIISPTGYGNSKKLPHGHVGIVGRHAVISTQSETGLLGEDFTIDTWHDLYQGYGNYPVAYFRVL